MYRKFLFLTSFVLVLSLAYTSYGADTVAPRPSPMRWMTVPATRGPTEIQMGVPTALDAGGSYPCYYYFECTTNGAFSSGWISEPNYTVSGLAPDTTYYFRAKAKDSVGNETGWTASDVALTLPATTDACTTPPVMRLDLNRNIDNNDVNTAVGFLPFIPENSGSEVNGIVVDFTGLITSGRREDPCYGWSKYGGSINVDDPCFMSPRAAERLYRDMFSAPQTQSFSITLWGLGMDRDVNIMMWAYDEQIGDMNRMARWSANGNYVFTTSFHGGISSRPNFDNAAGGIGWQDLYRYAWKARVTTDKFGRIALTCDRDPNSPAAEPFAYCNALKVEPNATSTFTPTPYPHRPYPIDANHSVNPPCVPVNTALQWRNGASVSSQELYFGDDFNDVNTATSGYQGPGVLVYKPGLGPGDSAGTYPYNSPTFMQLDKTYYWRIDDTNTGAILYKGETWSFTTCPNSVVDSFNGYTQSSELRAVWKDSFAGASYGKAEVYMTGTDPNRNGPPGRSMRYLNKNYATPFWSKTEATIGTGAGKLKIDPDWKGMDACSVSLWFWGNARNDANQKMYLLVTDGSANMAKILYKGDMNDVRAPQWHEWNIAFKEFEANKPAIDLSNVSKVGIYFGGDGVTGYNDGSDDYTIFEDVQIYTTRCALIERDADYALLDYAPLGAPGGDCAIDSQEIGVIAGNWLDTDMIINTTNPIDTNLVVYYPMNEGDGNKIYSRPKLSQPSWIDANWTGTFWNNTNTASVPVGYYGTEWSNPGYDGSGYCVYMSGVQGARIQCGEPNNWSTDGPFNLRLGIGSQKVTPDDSNHITLSIWVKWLGRRTWDGYLNSKGQGLFGKRGGYSESEMIWTLWESEGGPGAFGLGHYASGDLATPDLVTATGLLNPFIGQWVHIAAAFPYPPTATDSNAQARLYLNGGQVAQGPWRFSRGYDANMYLTIGQTSDQNAWPDAPTAWYGYLDEARIYNRTLSQNEIGYLADVTPGDNLLWIPIPSPAEVYSIEGQGSKIINFKDFAVVVNQWLKEEMYPR